MPERRSKLIRNGFAIDLPLLVPSFSSRGSRATKPRKGSWRFDVAGELADFGHMPAKAVLVSAYDLHHRHLDLRVANSLQRAELALRQAGLVYIDSGGYELAELSDGTEPKPVGPGTKPFSQSDYEMVLTRLDRDLRLAPLVITNCDFVTRKRAVRGQANAARKLFEKYPRQMNSFLLKPRGNSVFQPRELREFDTQVLSGFDIVGVTADDLGQNLFERLESIHALRSLLDQAGIGSPIHVWGGLDPLITALYFFAGADVFDGVSWLRYGFNDGMAVSRAGYQLLSPDLGVVAEPQMVRGLMAIRNRLAMDRLAITLQHWRDNGAREFDMFPESVREPLRNAWSIMQMKIPSLKEG